MAEKIILGTNTVLGVAKQPALIVGAPVAVTRRILFNAPSPLTRNAEFWRGDNTRGIPSAAPTAYPPILVGDRATLPLAADIDMRDSLLWLLASIDAAPTNVARAGDDFEDITFEPAADRIPNISTFSLARGSASADGSPHAYAYANGFITGWNIAEGGGGLLAITQNWQLGREVEREFTDNIADPNVQIAGLLNRTMTMSVHNSFADALANQNPIAGSSRLSGITIGYTSGWAPVEERDGPIDYGDIAGSGRTMTIGGTAILTSEAADLAQAESRMLDQFRAVRIRMASPIEPYAMIITANVTHQGGSLVERDGVNAAGQATWSMAMRSAKVLDNDIRIDLTVHEDDRTAYGLAAP